MSDKLVLCLVVAIISLKQYDCTQKMNVLFIVSDDLRPQFLPFLNMSDSSITKYPYMHTPYLNKLMEDSLIFRRAYCQYPLCSPSRTSFLTGRRPDTTRIVDLRSYFRKQGGDFTTIPQFFKQNDYLAHGIGKIFHQDRASNNYDPVSWTTPQEYLKDDWWKQRIIYQKLTKQDLKNSPLHDTIVTKKGLKFLKSHQRAYKKDDKNFFLALGYRKPHLPFTVPEKFFEYYKDMDSDIPSNYYVPQNLPGVSYYKSWEFKMREGWFPSKLNDTVPTGKARDIRKAYYAAVSYMDYQVGKVLKGLKKYGFADNTIVVFLGDHGFHLGENGMWGKRWNLEADHRTPLLIKIPGKTDGGKVTDKLVELVDVFPTLVEAAGFPAMRRCPKSPQKSQGVKLCTEGDSLLPLVEDPESSQWKEAVFSQVHYPHLGVRKDYEYVGYTVRTDRYRYCEWYPFDPVTYTADWNNLKSVDFFDRKLDPGENKNIPLPKGTVIEDLHKLLEKAFKKK